MKSKLLEKFSVTDRSAALHIFDIDDTLFTTTARAMVVNEAGVPIKTLSPAEFSSYELKPGESLDYGQFIDAEKFHRESIPIDSMVENFKRIHAKVKLNFYPGSEVIVITARSELNDRELFFQTFRRHGMDIDSVDVHCVGDPPGQHKEPPAHVRKHAIVRTYLERKPFKSAMMYDDSSRNLSFFLTLKQEFPDTNFYAYLVRHGGSIAQFTQ